MIGAKHSAFLLAIAILGLAACTASPVVPVDGGMEVLDATGRDVGLGEDSGSPVDGGPPGCASDAECDDGVNCTEDTCTLATGACRHQVLPALCPAGSSCHPTRGCEMGRPCATDVDCEDTDACTVNERCDPAARTCVVDPLDGDGDGDPPRVCSGGDCDDSNAGVYAGADERCNTLDDDCDGRTDEGLEATVCAFCETVNACHDEDMHACYVRVEAQLDALGCGNRAAAASAIGACASSSCSEYRACRDAAGVTCTCPSGRTFCGGFFGSCADTSSDDANCGSCGRACPFGTTCDAGTCMCPTGLTLCGTSCVDTTTDFVNCGMCGRVCPSGATCTAGACVCPAGETACGTNCVDTTNDEGNCGTCGRSCAASELCDAGSCVRCGVRGNPCCFGACEGALSCGYDVPDGLCIQNDACWFVSGRCAATESCFVSISAGFAFCAARTGSLPLGATCDRYTECATGLTCADGRCQRVCDPLEACPAGGTCSSSSDFGTCCGALGDECCPGFGGGTCAGFGTCNTANTCECVSGTTACGDACVATASDPLNCGACGRACGASQNCVGGTCTACAAEGAACCLDGSSCGAGLLCVGSTCRRAAACDVFAQTGCRAGEACYADEWGAGTYCAPAGSGARGSACSADTDCAAGTGCAVVIRSMLCRSYCDTTDGVPGCMSGEACSPVGRTGPIGICR